ncbi:hypothetical protein FRX31_015531 [Thalictrum thalictroides]|uniref:Uncharacterized protein n=1 Tax=Thalictrum thalictroides TaxID=46969 RepID=A0A7J6WC32_THATH|nr:hypothetical protein FRX31_015531 [Thalictrum thalictroides]
MLRSSATAASRVLKLIAASSRPFIFHPTRTIVSTPINPIRQFLVSDPISRFSIDQSRGYSSNRCAAASSSKDDENENDDEEFDSDDVVEFDSGDEDNIEVDDSDDSD